MIEPPEPPPCHPRDPIGWTVVIALVFLAMCLWRLTIPSKPFFDEVHYLPAARAVLALSYPANPEHPPLAKELIAVGIAVFGDRPLGWRLPSALFDTFAAGIRRTADRAQGAESSDREDRAG